MKRKTAELDQAKNLPCVHCETYRLSSVGRSQCIHGLRPNKKTLLLETKKETEMRERREKVEKGRARKARKMQSEMEGVSFVDGCKDDEYDLESALLAIEGSAQGSKPKAKKIQKTKSKSKASVMVEMRNTSLLSGGDRSSNLEKISANDFLPVSLSLLDERGSADTCSTLADEEVQMHLKGLLFGENILKQMACYTNKVKKVDHIGGIKPLLVLSEQV